MIGKALLGAAAILAITPVSAATITPVSVSSTSSFPFNDIYQPVNLIDGSGLSDGLHGGDFNDMFLTALEDQQATLLFDLGGVFTLTGANIWNYNFGLPGFFSLLRRGVRDFTVDVSITGTGFDRAYSGTLTQGTGQPLAAETFGFNATGRYVAINILNNYASGDYDADDTPSGLSEVRFDGVAAVPEPATWAMMLLGFGLVGAMARRHPARVFA